MSILRSNTLGLCTSLLLPLQPISDDLILMRSVGIDQLISDIMAIQRNTQRIRKVTR